LVAATLSGGEKPSFLYYAVRLEGQKILCAS
jgi:hypothetical protein